jgi:Kef-type K+ transport system membrane component KefB
MDVLGGGGLSASELTSVFISLALIIALAAAGGALFRALQQPPVIGEILAGIALGPSLLGVISPGLPDRVLPTEARPFLQLIAHLGLVLFMVLVGLEVDLNMIRGRRALLAGVSAGSLALPFGIGVALALLLADQANLRPPAASSTAFVLFLGTALSVTAFPVLARIIRDRGLAGTDLGVLALAVAAVTDVVAWSLLALDLSIASDGRSAIRMLAWALVAVVLAFGVARPLLAAAARRRLLDRLPARTYLVCVGVAALIAAALTSLAGLHDIFGAFLVGLVLPRTESLTAAVEDQLDNVATGLLLPAFFVIAGLSVNLTIIFEKASLLWLLVAVVVVALVSKVAGGALPAVLRGMPGREALRLGVLLSSRGLTELVVLSIGYEAGLLGDDLYTVLVAAAVITTVLTGPLLTWLGPDPSPARPRTPAKPLVTAGNRARNDRPPGMIEPRNDRAPE